MATIRSAAAKSVTDSYEGTARPPRSSISRHTVAAGSSPVGVAPQAHAQVVDDDGGALARQGQGELAPMPRPAPVTTATRSF